MNYDIYLLFFPALSSEDYNSISSTVRFAPCVYRECVVISIIDDELAEEREYFTVVLSETPELHSRIRLYPTEAGVIISSDDSEFIDLSEHRQI